MLNPTRIRIDNAATSTTSAPSAATDGVAIPKQKRHLAAANGGTFLCQRIDTQIVTNGGTTPTLTSYIQLRPDGFIDLVLVKGAASGTRIARVKVFAYHDEYQSLTENAGAGMDTLAAVSSSGTWSEVYDTGVLSDAANFNTAFRIGPL